MARIAPVCAAVVALTLCAGIGALAEGHPPWARGIPPAVLSSDVRPRPNAIPLKHVVVIVMENRTVDNLFAGFYGTWPGLNIANPKGNPTLREITFRTEWDPGHDHGISFVTEFQNGKQQGWNKETFQCPRGGCDPNPTALAYVTTKEVKKYRKLAEHYAIADNVFQSNEGPSLPAHQYLIAGQSGAVGFGGGVPYGPYAEAENANAGHIDEGLAESGLGDNAPRAGPDFGCSSTHKMQYVDMRTPYPGVEGPQQRFLPCQNYPTIFDLLDRYLPGPSASHWSYTTPFLTSIWDAPIGVQHLYDQYVHGAANVSVDPGAEKFIARVKHGQLASVSYVIPCAKYSDHPDSNSNKGPSWVSYVANAIGGSQFWPDTAVIIVWDDWGGWYDHVQTGHPKRNPYGNPKDPNEWGFRVPLIVLSPYAKKGFIDHRPRSMSAILGFIESVYGLPSLGADDAYMNDNLFSMFDFKQKPLRWKPIPLNKFSPKCG